MLRLKIKEVAEQKGVPDAAELARRAGIAYSTAHRLWHGDIGGTAKGERSVGITTLHRIAKALGVKTSELYEEDGLTLYAASHQLQTA